MKIIVSYDGTDSDRDALALGRLLAGTDAALELAYVRHAQEARSGRERLAESDAEAMLAAGAAAIGMPDIARHVVLSASTPEGLRSLAVSEDADLIVFGSEYRTAPGHVDPQASARRLMDGGSVALAVAPAGFAEQAGFKVRTVAAVGENGDPAPLETAQALAARLGGAVASNGGRGADFVIVGSKPGTADGRVTISAAAEYLIELTRCPVLVLPRGVAVTFGRAG
jgi:nucleotide-binding universal stress UspA family protein